MKLNTRFILYILFLMPYFSSSIIMNNTFIMITRIISLISCVILFLLFAKEKNKFSYIKFLIFLISLWLLCISFYRNTLNAEILYLIYSWFSICMITYNSFNNNKIDFLAAFGFLLNIFVIINIPFLIKGIGVDAYERVFIFGGKNAMQMYFIPAIFVNYMLSLLKHNKLSLEYLLFIFLDIITVVICGASTGILAILLFLVFLVLRKNININIWLYIFILCLALILIFNTEYILKLEILYKFIVDILHKDLTFTARTKIWDYVFPFIINTPLGYGYGNSIVNSRFYWLNETHNMFLELLIIGGFPLLMLYCILVYNLLKKNPNKISNSLLVMCFTFFVIGLTESVQFHFQFWIVLIAYYRFTNSEMYNNIFNKNGDDLLAKVQ